MAGVKTAMMKATMSGLYHTGAHRLLAPYTQGSGVIFTLHHVRPPQAKAFAPNRILEVAPEFLDAVLDQVEEEEGLDVVSLDEAAQRLKDGEGRRFVCFTFDDGYRDNLAYAYPLFKRRSLPLTVRSIGGSARSTSPRSGGSCAPCPTATGSTQPRSVATW